MGKNVTLTVPQRLRLAHQILPEEAGSFREAKSVRKLRRSLQLSDSEKEKAGVYQHNGHQMIKDMSVLEDESYTLGGTEVEVICWGFDRLEEEGKVPTDEVFFELYEMFEEDIEEVTESEG